MAKLPADRFADGCDEELAKATRPVRMAKKLPIAKLVAHMLQWRMRNAGAAVYLRDQAETARGLPGAADPHVFAFRTSQTARCVRVSILTLGAVAGSGSPRLLVTTTTDAMGVYTNIVQDTAAATFPDFLAEHIVHVEVSPHTIEAVTIAQDSAVTQARILAIGVQEMPRPQLDTALDLDAGTFLGIDTSVVQAGTDIVTDDVSTIPLRLNDLRRMWKKVLFSNGKRMSTTSGSFVDFVTKSGANVLRWPYYPSVTLPQTTDPALTVRLYVLAQAAGGGAPTGEIRLLNTAGQIVLVTLSSGVLQAWNSGDVAIGRAASAWSYQGRVTGTATSLTVYMGLGHEVRDTV